MSQTPYQPLHAQAKAVTQADMWETLKKHLPPDSPLKMKGSEGQSPKEKPAVAALVWQKPVRTGEHSGYVLSACGRFSISKDCVKGAPMYMAWRRKEPPHDSTSLGVRLTLIEAQHLCEVENHREPLSSRQTP